MCNLTGTQLEENEKTKMMLTDRVEKMTQYRHDAKMSLFFQLEITRIMYSLGSEMIR